MEEKVFLVRYIKRDSPLFREGAIYEVAERPAKYIVVSGNMKGSYMDRNNCIKINLPEELFEWRE